MDSDGIRILPAVLHTAKAKALEWSAHSAFGLTPCAQGGLNGGCTSIEPRGAVAGPVDLARPGIAI